MSRPIPLTAAVGLLAALAACPSALAIPPAEPISFRTVAKGDGSGSERLRGVTISSERRMRKLWASLTDGEAPPEIDFSRHMLVAVTQGRQPSSGHEVTIERIEDIGRTLLVTVREEEPGRGCLTGGVITSPYHVVRLGRSRDKVKFERYRKLVRCRPPSASPGGADAAQQRCETPQFATGVGTFGAGAADSPRAPGRVLVRFGGRIPCPADTEWWFEYGTTAQYGLRTASNDAAVPIQTGRGWAVVRTDVDGLAYDQTYHYRLVVRYPDGGIETGGDTVVRVRPSALRPPQRVSFRWSRRPTPAGTILDRVLVHDAPPGSKVTVSCTGSARCKPFERKLVLGRGPTVFKNWRVRAPGYLTVVVAGAGVPTLTTIRPRPRTGPTVETECGGYPVVLGTRCIAVALQYQGPRVRRLTISDVPRGSRVEIACRGEGCPPRDQSLFVARPAEDPYARLSPSGYRRLRPGARLRIFITRANTYGLTRSFTVTRTRVIGSPYRCVSRTVPRRTVACPTWDQVTTGRGDPGAGD